MSGVLVVGDIMTDVIVRPEGPLVPGSDRRASIVTRPGGSGANQAAWLAAMGVPVRLVARVAAAEVARAAAHLTALRIVPQLAGDPAAQTGMLVSIIAPDGERSFLTDRGANLNLSPEDLDPSLLAGTEMLVLSGYSYFAEKPREAVTALARAARDRNLPVLLDAASAGFLSELGAQAFLAWTAGATTLFANAEEAEVLTGSREPTEQIVALGRTYPRVVLKRGAKGAMLGGQAGVRLALPAPLVEVTDSTGAGDAFAAGFIASELRGLAEPECLAAAIDAGARACQMVGGQPVS